MNVEPRHTIEELERFARKETSARVATRLRGVILAMRGREAEVIAQTLDRSRRAVQERVRWYNEEGLEALRDAPGGAAVHVILILDRAGWHVSPKLKVPSNITLLHLPPYSPELNPVERLWHWLRSHCLSNRIYRDVEHLYDAAAQAWNTVTTDRFKTVCRTPYMERGIQ